LHALFALWLAFAGLIRAGTCVWRRHLRNGLGCRRHTLLRRRRHSGRNGLFCSPALHRFRRGRGRNCGRWNCGRCNALRRSRLAPLHARRFAALFR
jgi:hypothetical protein